MFILRHALLFFFFLSFASLPIAYAQQVDLFLNRYNKETEIKASRSITLTDGFHVGAGENVRIFIGSNILPSVPSVFVGSFDRNYIRTRVFKVANVVARNLDSIRRVNEVHQSVQYMDGLGRPSQLISVQSSPSFKDIVQPIVYDAFGREAIKYLPYVASSAESNGSYKLNVLPEQASFYNIPPFGIPVINNAAYSETKFEASPLNRVVEQGFPGEVWKVSGNHTQKVIHGTNELNEVKLWQPNANGATTTSAYMAGTLSKLVSLDENTPFGQKAGSTEDFKDLAGNTVLKRIWETETVSSSTYYVYDNTGNLRYVLPPAVLGNSFSESLTDQVFNQFIYAYHYDGKKRITEKKLPGKGWEFILYNALDQIVASQDALQRAKSSQEWTIIKYDKLGRVTLTGIYAFPGSLANISDRLSFQRILNFEKLSWEERINTGNGYSNQSAPQNNIVTTLMLNYYDDYSVPGLPSIEPYNLGSSYSHITKDLQTVSRVNVLGTNQMLWRINYYDHKGNVVRSIQQYFKGGEARINNYDDVSNTYLFSGELSSSIRRHYVDGVEKLYVSSRLTYDSFGRPRDTYQKIGDNSGTTNLEVLVSRNNYNELGQLTSKELHSTNLESPSFAQTINYSYNSRGWLKSKNSSLFNQTLKYEEGVSGAISQYNGNISRQEWDEGKFYNYNYDHLDRLKSGLSSEANHEKSIRHDVMGNIISMQRYKSGDLVDQMQYNYNGNQLVSVVDSSTNSFVNYQLPGTTVYAYDLNGNMISRLNKVTTQNNIVDVHYNHLNLPSTMLNGDNLTTYVYDATGLKLSKQVGSSSLIEYIGGIQYENGVLKCLQTLAGRVVRNSATNYSYEYVLTDHLGNGRLYFDINSEKARKIQELDYYPFGLSIQKSLFGEENKHQYNGKEKQDEENMYDYGARFYDPVIGRWNVVDPLADAYQGLSPYNYVANNPLRYIDPNGMFFKEYENEADYRKENSKGKLDGSDGHWLRSDRENNTYVWDRANMANLQANLFSEYKTIDERTGFYGWITVKLDSKGFENNWPGAAYIVAGQMSNLSNSLVQMWVGDDVVKFANAGNKAIFNDVFDNLRDLYNGPVMKGKAAAIWDAKTLYNEQFNVVQPLYEKQSRATIETLSNMAKGNYLYGLGVSGALQFKGNLLSPRDRYNHGAGQVTNFFNIKKTQWKNGF